MEQKKLNINNYSKYVQPILYGICIVLSNYISNIFLYLAIVLVIIEIFSNDSLRGFYFSFFLIPNIRSLDGIGVTFMVNLLIVLPLVNYLKSKRGKMNMTVLTITLILFMIELIHITVLDNFVNFAPTICWILSFFLCFSILNDKECNISKKEIIYYLTMGCIVSAAVYLLSNLDYAGDIINKIISGNRFFAYADDPNYYSLYICVDLALMLSVENKNKLYYIGFLVLVSIGIFTASKMCIILMTSMTFLAIIMQLVSHRTKVKNHKFIFNILFIIILFGIFNKDIVLKFLDNFMTRIGDISKGIDLNTATTGRADIFKYYINTFFNNLILMFFGYGFQYQKYFNEKLGRLAHNTYMDILLSWGFIGTILLLCMLLFLFKKQTILNKGKKVNRNIIKILPLLILMINFMDLSCFNATIFWWISIAAISGILSNE